MKPQRIKRILETVSKRQLDLAVVLENVHDPHNIGAVLRTCDSIGVNDVIILYSQEKLINAGIKIGTNASSGARRWLNIHYFTDTQKCIQYLASKFKTIYTTAIGESAQSIYKTSFLTSCALVFGNEQKGVSQEMLAASSGNILIPQVGMVKSLNISVACAVTLYEAFRQRDAAGKYQQYSSDDKIKEELNLTYTKIVPWTRFVHKTRRMTNHKPFDFRTKHRCTSVFLLTLSPKGAWTIEIVKINISNNKAFNIYSCSSHSCLSVYFLVS